MRLIKSRKGIIFFPFIVIFTTIIMILALTILSSKTETIKEGLGKDQAEVFKTYQEGEKLLFYVDEAAKLSARQAAVELAEKGGFKDRSSCGEFILANLWNNQSRFLNCRPDYKKNYGDLINTDLVSYINGFSTINPDFNQSKNISFEYYVKDNKIAGWSGTQAILPILRIEKNEKIRTGDYRKRVSFNVDIDYNISQYEDLTKEAEDLVKACYNNTDLSDCVNANSKWTDFYCIQNLRQCSFAVKSGQNFTVFNKMTGLMEEKELIYKFGLSFGSSAKTRLVFIPVNWDLGESEFNKAANAQYNYFLSLIESETERNMFEKFVFYDNLNYIFGGSGLAVPLVEEKVRKNLVSYNKNNGFVAALAPKMTDESTLGHVWGQKNIVLVKYDSTHTLAHELGHAIWGFCDEYVYLDVSCENKAFETTYKSEILNNPEAFLGSYHQVQSGEIEIETFVNSLRDSGFTQEFLDNFQKCDAAGWLPQNYGWGSCPNPYPTCCMDSPDYLGDNNPNGANCYPGVSEREEAAGLCLGASCGPNCRSIMGADAPDQVIIRKYPS